MGAGSAICHWPAPQSSVPASGESRYPWGSESSRSLSPIPSSLDPEGITSPKGASKHTQGLETRLQGKQRKKPQHSWLCHGFTVPPGFPSPLGALVSPFVSLWTWSSALIGVMVYHTWGVVEQERQGSQEGMSSLNKRLLSTYYLLGPGRGHGWATRQAWIPL